MSTKDTLIDRLEAATAEGRLLASALANLRTWLEAPTLPAWMRDSVAELADRGEWADLNDRFYTTLAFGTGGLRGRTIAVKPTAHEAGALATGGAPANPAVGAACMNDINVAKATVGLFRHCAAWLQREGIAGAPSIVIAHDVRHFSRHFSTLAASIWTRLGGTAYVFDGPRSTPQLSFSIRHLRTTTGVVITASHNPPHDNGYKAYFSDGCQVVSPHAELIVKEVAKVSIDEAASMLDSVATGVVTLPASLDAAYQSALAENILDAGAIRTAAPKVVFTPIHGVGGVASLPLMRSLGVQAIEVPEQAAHDGRFPTVKSPNPESSAAFTLGIARAEAEGADVVLATDPDCDRMGAAIRGRDGKWTFLTGNMIGSMMADFRLRALKDKGVIPQNGGSNVALIKTFVTTDLAADIAREHGVKLVDTLTGFKFIGSRVGAYEDAMRKRLLDDEGLAVDFDACTFAARAKWMQKTSTFFVFGFEESYGYLASDRVRDKDANAAVGIFCEMAAWLKSQGRSLADYIDSLYIRHGYYLEDQINLFYEGAAGSRKIANIIKSLRKRVPAAIGSHKVTGFTDFGVQKITDADGCTVPSQDFYIVHLDNGYRFAIRGSGTEPKIKFYLFAREDVPSAAALPEAKQRARETLDSLRKLIEADARIRAEEE